MDNQKGPNAYGPDPRYPDDDALPNTGGEAI
jgi:hypothetical protein